MLYPPREVWVVQRQTDTRDYRDATQTVTDHFNAYTTIESAVEYIELQFGQDIYVYDPEDGTWTGPWHNTGDRHIRWRWSVINAPLRYETIN